jgi:hypothetical protein
MKFPEIKFEDVPETVKRVAVKQFLEVTIGLIQYFAKKGFDTREFIDHQLLIAGDQADDPEGTRRDMLSLLEACGVRYASLNS